MGIFDSVFGRRKTQNKLREYFETLTAYRPAFTSINGGLYEAEITRSAIHTIATHFSKLEPTIKGQSSKNSALDQKLKFKPNEWQTTSQWLYRTATILLAENNAFIVPLLDREEKLQGYYTVCPSRCEVLEYNGTAWLRYQFKTGKVGAIELDRCAIINQFQYRDDLFGEDNGALNPTLQLIRTQNEGIVEGIKNSASIRFIGKLGNVLAPEHIDEERARFRSGNFASENTGGIVLVDGKYTDLKQIESRPYIVDAQQMSAIKNNVYNYFGVNEKILRNEWNENDIIAFYEGKIEPIALQVGLGLTAMTFTETERLRGNRIELSEKRIQYATTEQKINLGIQAVDRGIMSRNEVRDLLQMDHIEGGDEYIIRAEYIKSQEGEKNADN